MEEKPNYYAVIPANVRYSSMSHFCKLLYAEVSALSNKEGHCWATNGYFARIYEVTKETISRSFSQLEDRGFITITLEYEGKQIKRRIIKIINTPHDKNVYTPIDENVKENTIKKNTTRIEYNRDKEDFDRFWSNLNGRKVGKNDAFKAYSKIDTEFTAEELSEKFNLLLASREEKFVPYPQKWLRNESWNEAITNPLTPYEKSRMITASVVTVGELTEDDDKEFPNEEYFQETISEYKKEKNMGMVEYYTREHEKWKKDKNKGKI